MQFPMRDFTLTQLEDIHHFSILCKNFLFNVTLHRWCVGSFIFCNRLAGSDVTVTPSVTCMKWLLHWWYNHVTQIYFPLQKHWLFLPTWVRNRNLYHLVKSKWKMGER